MDETTPFDLSTANNTEMPTKPPGLQLAYDIVMIGITTIIMFSMGSGTSFETIKERIKKPVGPVIGLVCQCFAFPALMYGYAVALDIDDAIAVGMVICSSCPGGAVSNMFTFWTRGDLDLSITMTTISTALAVGFMPLNMYIYVRQWLSVSDIPFLNMVITIFVVWAAVVLGNITGRVFPKSVYYLTRIGSVGGFTLILVAAVIQGNLYPEVFDLDWTVWFAAITMPFIAFLIGFFVPWCFCLDQPQRTAIAMEVSFQNTALGLTIITVSFPNAEEASYYSQYVILYGTFQIVFGVGLSILFQSCFRYFEKTTPCHRYSRWKHGKQEALTPDLQQVKVNGATLTADPNNTHASLKAITNMSYSGSSLKLQHLDINSNGFSEAGRSNSTTELIRMDSTISTDSNTGILNEMNASDSASLCIDCKTECTGQASNVVFSS